MKGVFKKTASIVLSALMLTGSLLPMTSQLSVQAATQQNIQAEFFVSPDGNDQNDGSYEKPFATLQAARDAVRKINENMTGDIYVFVMPGTYYVTETIDFTTEDSATNGYEIIYKCLGNPSEARFVGGIKVNSEWTSVSVSEDPNNADSDMQESMAGKIFKTNLKAQMDETFGEDNWPATSGPLPLDEDGKFTVNTLTVNQDRVTLARTLNSEKFDGMPSTLFDNPLYTAGGSYTDMSYKQEDASKLFLEQLQNAQARGDLSAQIVCNDIGGKRAWDSDTLPITNVDTSARKMTFNPNDVGDFTPLYAVGGDSRYYLQGNLAFLDTPGEFYYNPKTFDLYYYPQDGEENLEEQEIIVPTTDQVIRVEGERTGIWDDTEITPVENLVFDGFTFSDTSFPDYYSSGYPWLPYASGSPSKYAFPEWSKQSTNPIYCGSSERPQFQVGTVHLQYTDHITIRNCNIRNAGMNGIEMYLGVTNTLVSNSLVEYCGNGGIMIEGGFPGIDGNSDAVSYTNHNTVENTIVHDVGQMVHQTFGIQIANATYNTVQNCEVYHSPRRGILLMGSDIGSWNNTASGNRNWSPIAYDVKRDEYAHGNTFSNIYLHDVQQDGGDDGGLFAVFVYYNTHNFSRPNYFDQIVINEVGAQPNMSDISPNNINLDMGWCGIEMSNVKTVNPQHYTIENSNLQNGQVKVDNCTFYFKNPKDGLDSFDDSKMDYANIGVQTWRYPAEYRHAITNTKTERPDDAYFSEDFENELDWEKWSYRGNTPELSRIYMSEGPFNGKSALVLNNEAGGEKPVLYREFEETLNKTVTVKIFDRQLSPSCTYSGEGKLFPDTGRTLVRVDGGTEDTLIAMGIDPDVDRNYYTINLNGEKSATPIRRVFGWHELTFDYSEEGKVTLYIDGVQVGTAQREGFSYVALGSEDGTGENYYDQLYIYGGKEAAAADKTANVKKGAAKSADVRNAAETYVDWKFEDDTDFPYNKDETYGTPFQQVISSGMNYSGVLSGNTMLGYFNTSFSIAENPVKDDRNSSDYVLARSGEGGCHGYAQQEPEWGNYIWEFDYLYKSSSATAKDNSVNFILNCQNKNDGLGSGYPYQPAGYWFSINEGENSLILRKRTAQQGSPTDLARITLEPEVFEKEFNNTELWHTVAFYAKNGSDYTDLCVVVDDGKYILEAKDSSNPFTSGTIAFNSMGTNFYMDNIQIEGIEDSPLTGYDENFGLENVQLTEKFTPSITTYEAVITDPTQPVTMKKPDGAGAEYTISLNGQDITADFPDTETPVTLGLKPGNNELIVTETTAQYIKTEYRVSMYKECTLVSTDIPEIISTSVGQMPQLPSECEIVVNDGMQDVTMTSAVRWEMADQSQYKEPGSFTLNGTLTELENEKVSVEIQVDGIVSIEALDTVQGKAGTSPMSLLAKQIAVEYQYSGTQQKEISFKELSSSVYAEEGTVIAVGTVDGYEQEVIQLVELKSDETSTVNKTLLQKTYDYALTLDTEGVVESAVKLFEQAKANAKAVLDDPNATQEEVNAAWDELLEGIWSLGLTQGDKTMLEQLIAKAETMIPNQDKYVQDHWQELVDALEAAKKVMDDGDAMEEDVVTATDALMNAILAQRYKADKSILEGLINKANSLDLSQYSAESVAVFKAALAEANLVLADESLSEDDQKIVDAAVQKLDAAIENLSAPEDGEPSKPEGGDEGSSSNPDKGNPDKGEEGTQAPATGDHSDTAILFTAVFAMMMLAALAVIWRRKQNEM